MTALAEDFDALADLLSYARSLPREDAFRLVRNALAELPESPLRRWAMYELADMLGWDWAPPRPEQEVRVS